MDSDNCLGWPTFGFVPRNDSPYMQFQKLPLLGLMTEPVYTESLSPQPKPKRKTYTILVKNVSLKVILITFSMNHTKIFEARDFENWISSLGGWKVICQKRQKNYGYAVFKNKDDAENCIDIINFEAADWERKLHVI